MAAFAREYKKFKLRCSLLPQEGMPLAGVMRVADSHGKGFIYIKFSEALVEAVGKVMQFGISDMTPCYLSVVVDSRRKVWRVYSFYVGETRGSLLWVTDVKPKWYKQVRRK